MKGKWVFNAVSAGGSKEVYAHEGRNRYSIPEFLRPFEQTARLCQMIFLPPFVVHHANIATRDVCSSFGVNYAKVLTALSAAGEDASEFLQREYLNIHQYREATL